MRALVALALAVSANSVAPAWAASDCGVLLTQGFSCAVPLAKGQAVGQLVQYGVNIQRSGAGGFTPLHATRPLNVGDQLTVGSQGMTILTAGPSCQTVLLPVGASLEVTVVGDCAAVQVLRPEAVASGGNVSGVIDRRIDLAGSDAQPQSPVGGQGTGAGLALGAALLAGGLTAVLLINNNKQVSP